MHISFINLSLHLKDTRWETGHLFSETPQKPHNFRLNFLYFFKFYMTKILTRIYLSNLFPTITVNTSIL